MQREKTNEIIAIFLMTVGVFFFLSLATFHPEDLSFFSAPHNIPVKNLGGSIGAHLGGFLIFCVGVSGYVIPVLLIIWGINRFLGTMTMQRRYTKLIGTCILILGTSAMASLIIDGSSVEQFRYGGFTGYFLSMLMARYCGIAGSYVILSALIVLSLILATEFMIFPALIRAKDMCVALATRAMGAVSAKGRRAVAHEERERNGRAAPRRAGRGTRIADKVQAFKERFSRDAKEEGGTGEEDTREVEFAFHADTSPGTRASKKKKERTPPPFVKKKRIPAEGYTLPSYDLLDTAPPVEDRKIKQDLKTNSEILESTLLDFDIETKVVRVEQGPVITRYELEPAPGVKINRITALADNIALVMKAQSVRIVAPIPGKGTVGVEVPNSASSMVYLREVMDSEEFRDPSSKISLAFGKDIGGKPLVADLTDMPHLLIAGATGSGKTVCVNSIITGLLFTMSPKDLKLLLIDPKMVELAVYNGLPHLLCPVVTDAKKAAISLNWVVNEMEKRYKMLATVGARNIDTFNTKLDEAKELLTNEEGEALEALPYIVVIIDELADLMMVARDNIENAITRLAQLSRAVGIHIILATQRPSVDVITGVIKANFPARISFKVSSKVDSRTVLDINGADKLLGKGDMLFIEPGATKPVRAQGSLITDKEIERIVRYVQSQSEAMYDDEIVSMQEKKSSAKTIEKDELFEEGVRVVLQTKQASVSMLQRKLGLGYTRAARLIDAMEDEGIVGPYRGSKPREILIDSEQYKTV